MATNFKFSFGGYENAYLDSSGIELRAPAV